MLSYGCEMMIISQACGPNYKSGSELQELRHMVTIWDVRHWPLKEEHIVPFLFAASFSMVTKVRSGLCGSYPRGAYV
jgi:hypothetical protein